MSNRINTGLRTLAGIAALVVLGLVISTVASQLRKTSTPANGNQNFGNTTPVKNLPLIAFTAGDIPSMDIYIVKTDGTGSTNLTNSPYYSDRLPVWSPDGSKLAFVSDRDGNDEIYVMNPDGSNVTRLTNDPASDTNPLWSPDGTKIAYTSGDFTKNNTNIYVMDSNGQNQHRLTDYVPNTTVSPSAWSLDSQFIFFNAYRQIVKVNVNDGNITTITPQTDVKIPLQFVLSKDGSTLLYQADCNSNDIGTNEYCTLVKSIQANGENDKTLATLKTPEACLIKQTATWTGEYVKWSPDQTKLLFAFTCKENGWLYIANADGSDFKQLTNYPILGKGPDNEVAMFDWSPDSQSIVFMSALDQPKKDNLYILNVNDALNNPATRPTRITNGSTIDSSPAWQPIANDITVEPKPTPQTNNRLIAFTSPQDGNSDIFVMNSDGSGIRNLTNSPATDRNPVWSPDGQRIAFESDRNGKFDVYTLNADGSNLTQITADPAFDVLASSYDSPWSPDGKQILIQSTRSGQDALYVASTDGKSEAIKISDTSGFAVWSPLGNQVAYAYISAKSGLNNNSEQDAVRIVNADGSNPRDIVQGSLIQDVYWSLDGKTLYYRSGGTGVWNIESVNAEGGTPETVLHIEDSYFPGMAWFSPDSTIVYESSDPPQGLSSSLYRLKAGKSSLVGQLSKQSEICGTTDLASYSQNAIVSHDTTKALSYMKCDSGQVIFTAHDLINNTSTLLGKLSLANADEINITWSQDDQIIAIRVVQSDISQSSAAQTSLYIISRDELSRPPVALKPIIEQTNGLTKTAIQPKASNSIVGLPTPEPTQTNRLIAFVSEQSGNSEIYTMNTDGSDIRNITNNPTYDGNPVWSPDGSKIAFESDRNGNRDIFMVNADGSGLTQLTNDPANDVLGAFPQPQRLGYKTPDVFSPDGNHILFANDKSGQWKLYVMNADGSGVTQLVQANDPLAVDARWSPDGKQIAYILGNASGLGQMIAVNSDGTNRRAITVADPAKGDNAQIPGRIIGWSQDEKSLNYEYNTGSGTWYIIKATTDSSGTMEKIADGYALDTGLFIDGWLGSDSVLSYITNEMGGKYGSRLYNTQNGKTISWNYMVSCGYILPGSSRQPNVDGDSPLEKLGASKSGSQGVLGISCPNKGYSELYSLDSNSATIAKIAQIPAVWDTININWSADDQTVLIQGNDKSGKTDLYILNTEELQKKSPVIPAAIWSGESSEAFLQPVPFNGLAVKNPSTVVPSTQTTSITAPLWTDTSKGDLIAYVSNANGNSDIYLSKNDGTGITNLTNRSADDFDPTWSPDGNMLSFASGVNGKYSLHIMRPDGSNEKQIADTWWGYAWSPDSTKIAYLVSVPDNSSDAYSPAKISVKVIDLNGNILQDTALGTHNKADQLKWSLDGQSLSYVVTELSTTPVGEVRTTESDLYQLKLGGDAPVLLVKSDKTIDAWTMRGDTLTYLIRDYIEWDLFQINGNGQKKLATFGFDQIKCGVGANQASQFTYNYGSENTTKNFSPDGKYISFQVLCDDGSVWLYLGSIDGNFFKLIDDQPINDDNLAHLLSWSSDSKNIVFSAGGGSVGNSNIYKMNIDSAIQNPAISPIPLTTSGFDEHNPVWQPKP